MYKLKYLSIFILVIAFLFVHRIVFADSNNVTQLVFISTSQSIPVGDISTQITVQTQNTSGVSEQISETSDLNLSSTGSGGEFSSNATTWNPVNKLTMSTNTANKNFYYKNSIPGSYTITAHLVGRISGKDWTATQVINIGTTTVSDPTPTPPIDPEVPTSTIVTITKTKTVYISTHDNPEELSNYDSNSSFEVSAGRERLSYVGIPVEFSEKHKLPKVDSSYGTNFEWSFGDAFKDSGQDVTHAYKYPGEYNVILNAISAGDSSVSRTKIKILPINLSLISDSGNIKITNNGNNEINLGNFKLKGEEGTFTIAKDTIVSPHGSISLSYIDTKIGNSSISFADPSGGVVALIQPIQNTLVIATSSPVVLQDSAALIPAPIVQKELKKPLTVDLTPKVIKETIQTASVIEAIRATSTGNFFQNMLKSSLNGMKSIARIFYNF